MKSSVYAAVAVFTAVSIAASGTSFAANNDNDSVDRGTKVASLMAAKNGFSFVTPKSEDKEETKVAKTPYTKLIKTYAKQYGVPVELAHAVVRVESNFNPRARGSAGEIGLMQIKPATARMIGYSGSAKGLYDPETNIQYGMKYLAMAHELGGGDTCGTILRYNAGHAAKRMNPVSAAYCRKVQAILR